MAKAQIRIDDVRLVWSWDVDGDSEHLQHCEAVAEVSYPIDKAGNRRIEWLKSGGLGGIDIKGPNDPYQQEVELEQLTDLRDHLKTFGIETRDFASRFAKALQG